MATHVHLSTGMGGTREKLNDGLQALNIVWTLEDIRQNSLSGARLYNSPVLPIL